MVGSSLNKTNWEILRTNEEAGVSFAIAKNAADYEAECLSAEEYKNKAEIIIKILQKFSAPQRVISFGVGKGVLEWHLKHLAPSLTVECTDYTEGTIEQLRNVFRDLDDAYCFDMLTGDYSKFAGGTVIMHRLSAEFSRETWYQIFENMYDAGVSHVLFIPTELATPIDMLKEKLRFLRNLLLGRKNIFCGWLYSESEFLGMFKGTRPQPLYQVKDTVYYNHSAVFYLERNE